MTALESWLQHATRCLSKESAAQVRAEIQEHFESAREDAIAGGATANAAEGAALAALGNPGIANREYRRVLLTAAEARMLRDAKWESQVFSCRAHLGWALRAIPLIALCFAAISTNSGISRILLAAAIAMGLVLAVPTLPIYTPLRSQLYRYVKWIGMTVAVGLAFGPHLREWSWLLPTCLWPLLWIEWMRMSIRRKLPVAKWPKQLYL